MPSPWGGFLWVLDGSIERLKKVLQYPGETRGTE